MNSTTSRLLLLLSLLQSRRDWPGAVLAERLEVSARTVRRDVERLREMGYSIQAVKGPDGGYQLQAGAELPPLLFDDDQAVALAVALRAVVTAGADVGEAAVRALTTMRQVMPSRLRHRLDAVRFTALPSAAGSLDPVSPDVLIAVSAAIRAQEVLRFDYAGVSAQEDARPRRAEPHHLVVRDGRWYLVAWDLEREDWRVFRADRMAPRTPTGPRFVRRRILGGVSKFLTARFRGSEAGEGWPCVGSAVLRLPARDVMPFVHDGAVEDLGSERCRVEVGSWSWTALAASLGRFDADIEAVEPAALREAFAGLASRFAAAAAAAGPEASSRPEPGRGHNRDRGLGRGREACSGTGPGP